MPPDRIADSSLPRGHLLHLDIHAETLGHLEVFGTLWRCYYACERSNTVEGETKLL